MTMNIRKHVDNLIYNAKAMWARVCLAAGMMTMAVTCPAYATGLTETINTTITDTVDRSLGALAAMMVVGALITGAMSAKDFAEGSQSNNPEQQDKGTKKLTYAVGLLVASGILLGIRATIKTVINSAIAGT